MRNVSSFLATVVWVTTSAAQSPTQPAVAPCIEVGQKFLAQIVAGDFKTAVGRFDATMKRVMPADKLQQTWESLIGQIGAYEEQLGARTEQAGPYDIALITVAFERTMIDVKVVVNRSGQISGLFFLPSTGPQKTAPPPYGDPAKFDEHEVSIGEGAAALPGTLAIPKGAGPFAAVVLVHGSGPQDRNETIGPNQPFRDLAWGLATRGVAVLRYEKRTKAHPAEMQKLLNTLTVKEETIDDALLAVDLLRHRKEVDAKSIFVLGHSLGGMVAPRIGQADGKIPGLILMAGSTRPLEDLIVEQSRFILSRGGELSEGNNAKIKELEKQAARVKDPALKLDTPAADLPLGVHAAYWLDLRKNDPPAIARTIRQPMLILQGESDYQVTMKDLARWKEALGKEKRVTIKTYPKLNHLFIAGEGPMGPAQYEKAGHVDEQVVADIAAWVKQIKG